VRRGQVELHGQRWGVAQAFTTVQLRPVSQAPAPVRYHSSFKMHRVSSAAAPPSDHDARVERRRSHSPLRRGTSAAHTCRRCMRHRCRTPGSRSPRTCTRPRGSRCGRRSGGGGPWAARQPCFARAP
jgi:hypothetical protein